MLRIRFKCYRCVHCCFFTEERENPILLWHEVLYYTKIGELMNLKLNFKNLGHGFYRFIIDGYCPFYDIPSRACQIQKEKPLSCKMFPILVNLASLEVSTSLMCPWVYENIDEISRGLSGDDIEKVFSNEFKALKEVVKWVYTVPKNTPKLAVYFTTYFKNLASDIIKAITERYEVIKVTESSVVDGFYYILIEGDADPSYLESLLKRDEITWYKLEKVPPIT
ncbi:MAG: YkgJ family cysteine cluster protein [Sulfolobales archaeon]